MPYEPGSPECRVLIDCKAQIETMLLALSRIDNSRHIRDQLVSVHNQLEGLHELHRRQPLAALAGGCARVLVTDVAQPKLDIIARFPDGAVKISNFTELGPSV